VSAEVRSEHRPTVAEIDLSAIRHNVQVLKPSGAELMAVVKADAYGHGLVPVAKAALEAGATWLGVALLEEAIALREAGVDARILMLSEVPEGSERDAVAFDVTPSVYSEEAIDRLASQADAAERPVPVHVKVDTGMHRVGRYPPESAVDLATGLVTRGLELEGLWTHFASSESDPDSTRAQLARFREVVEQVHGVGLEPRYLHAANSAAILLYPESHLDLVRLGAAMYGLDPGEGLGRSADIRPALSWRSRVTLVKRLPAGEAVSYGHTYRLEREATVATVPVGYADGYSRRLSCLADVLVHGRRCRVAGNVTMDQILIDCGDLPVRSGDEAVLLGRQGDEAISAEELAEASGTINREVTCAISARVPRTYLD
jgi:alanine racemase